MSELDLAAAVAAARRTADAVTSDAGATRRRIRETLERRRGGRTRRFTLVGVLAATLFGSTAFAYYSKPWRHEPTIASAPPAAAVVDTVDDVDVPRVRERVVDDVDAPPERNIVDDRPTQRLPAPIDTAPTKVVSEPDVAAPPQQAAPDPELGAYRVAYDAHFHRGSPAAALAAWDAYLAAYPDGKLATDARYNRAIILVKLKRYRDAADALRPLATAPEGAYRRAEAARLLNALPR